jgi:hypothetical protein
MHFMGVVIYQESSIWLVIDHIYMTMACSHQITLVLNLLFGPLIYGWIFGFFMEYKGIEPRKYLVYLSKWYTSYGAAMWNSKVIMYSLYFKI